MRTLSARDAHWSGLFAAVLVMRLLFPFFDSPLTHLYSDPMRHWENGRDFLHPSVMGSGDPYLYQLWLFSLRWIAGTSTAAILTGCGALCAAMPYGWYRALRELLPRFPALAGAIVIGLWPSFLGAYAYFMTETLLLTLTGFAFWLTLRAWRKRTLGAFTLAFALWLAASFTRIVLLPIGVACLVIVWIAQPHKWRALALALVLTLIVAIPAGLHARMALGYFSPLGNLYLNEIYHASGARDIQIDYGPRGSYVFGSPSFYNPTFYPFSDWTTSRQGTFAITVNTQLGRADWRRWLPLARAHGAGGRLRDFGENLCYLLFGQAWPDNDRANPVCWLEVWLRWTFLPTILLTLLAVTRGVYRGREWLLPGCALLGLLLLAVQREGIMEGRYRKPLEPIFLAALTLSVYARGRPAERR